MQEIQNLTSQALKALIATQTNVSKIISSLIDAATNDDSALEDANNKIEELTSQVAQYISHDEQNAEAVKELTESFKILALKALSSVPSQSAVNESTATNKSPVAFIEPTAIIDKSAAIGESADVIEPTDVIESATIEQTAFTDSKAAIESTTAEAANIEPATVVEPTSFI